MSAEGQDMGDDEKQLLAKLLVANRSLEQDSKSVQSLSVHSRQNSLSSQLSCNSLSSFPNDEDKGDKNDRVDKPNANSTEDQLWERWGHVVNNWDQYTKKRSYLKELVRKGVPNQFRPLVWQMMANAHDSPLKIQYADYLKRQSPSEKAIRRDIARTYPKHELFKDKDGIGQESLFHVMKAYSLHDREVGYCQGSGFIVGLLLMQMPEEEAFSVLVHMMQDYRLRELFKPSMEELGLVMYQLECLLQDHLPALFVHFQAQNFTTTLYASSWFLTLFTTTFSIPVTCRILDLFISEGMEIIFKLAIAYLLVVADHLLNLDMEAMLQYMQSEAPKKIEEEPTFLFDVAFEVKINTKRMKRLEKEYTAIKMREEKEQIELRRLRTENSLLLQRIERLEKDNEAVADKLVHYQVTRAQEAEQTYGMRRELSTYRNQCDELSRKLIAADEHLCLLKTKRERLSSSGQSGGDILQQLQTELVGSRLREAETNAALRDAQARCRKLEQQVLHLSKNPTSEVASLQEELILVKLQLAESNLSSKELKKRVNDLDRLWEEHMCRTGVAGSVVNQKTLAQELMSLKLKESALVVEIKESRQKVMEMEAQQEICSRQIARRDEEFIAMKEQLQSSLKREKELRGELRQAERRVAEVEAKRKEDIIVWRIQAMESSSNLAELQQTVANLESQQQEMVTHNEIHVPLDDMDNVFEVKDMERNTTLKPADSSESSSSNSDIDSPRELSTNGDITDHSNRTLKPSQQQKSSLTQKWKDIPPSIMTASIGPLEDLCFVPDDPMITSIYIDPSKSSSGATANQGTEKEKTPGDEPGSANCLNEMTQENPDESKEDVNNGDSVVSITTTIDHVTDSQSDNREEQFV